MKHLWRDGLTPLEPHHIDTDKHPVGAFGEHETEEAAQRVVRFCQGYGAWVPFSEVSLEAAWGGGPFQFRGLVKDGWLVIGPEGLVHLTVEFIARMYAASPKIPPRTS